ncbi:MAG: hypothetical protein RJB38_458 [Pseudomonadota bacterium]
MTPSGRTIIIGDIHGCTDELQALLRACEASAQDQIISVGDLICKGPDSLGALLWATETPNVRCVQGNHEARFLDCWRKQEVPQRKPYDLETATQLGNRYEALIQKVSQWPLYLEFPQFSIIHAGVHPSISGLSKQNPQALLELRLLPDSQEPWYDRYEQKHLLVFGHWVHREPVVRPHAIGLDTGCVYGGSLSALILPERRIVQVAAKRAYRKKDSWPR